jgi:hypothetical protein
MSSGSCRPSGTIFVRSRKASRSHGELRLPVSRDLPRVDYPGPGIRGSEEGPGDHVDSLLEAEKRRPRRHLDEGQLAEEDRTIKERARNVRDERFSDYLASSFAAGGALRYERRIQRNKTVLLAIVVIAVLVWVLRRLLT